MNGVSAPAALFKWWANEPLWSLGLTLEICTVTLDMPLQCRSKRTCRLLTHSCWNTLSDSNRQTKKKLAFLIHQPTQSHRLIHKRWIADQCQWWINGLWGLCGYVHLWGWHWKKWLTEEIYLERFFYLVTVTGVPELQCFMHILNLAACSITKGLSVLRLVPWPRHFPCLFECKSVCPRAAVATHVVYLHHKVLLKHFESVTGIVIIKSCEQDRFREAKRKEEDCVQLIDLWGTTKGLASPKVLVDARCSLLEKLPSHLISVAPTLLNLTAHMLTRW